MKLGVDFCVCLLTLFLCTQPCVSFEPITGITAGVAGIVAGVIVGFERIKCRFYECCDERWTKANVTGLHQALTKSLYGQHLVIDVVTKHIKGHSSVKQPAKALVFSFHGWTGTGKNYVSKIVSEHLYKKGMKSKFVHLIAATKEFPHESKIPEYKDFLRETIESSVRSCPESLFIFDEMDKMPIGLIDIIKPYLEHYEHIGGLDYRRSTFIFLSNTAGNEISKHALSHWKEGKQREDIKLKDMEKVITSSALNTKSGLWHSELITKHLITAFIPFLPLERRHVKDCIKDALVNQHFFNSTKDIDVGVISQIAEELFYYPEEEGIYSTTGCKRVQEKVSLIMETID
ncbi:hypothetical protein ScPMuIL_011048 [Solemya velum]